eukprot:2970873-Alexandrium_andersonii.AAC.1
MREAAFGNRILPEDAFGTLRRSWGQLGAVLSGVHQLWALSSRLIGRRQKDTIRRSTAHAALSVRPQR